MREFEDLSAEEKLSVTRFIEDNIEKHFKEHQRYTVRVEALYRGIKLHEDDEIGEPEIQDVWYECSYYDEKAKMHCGKSQMGVEDTINHAMWHLGLREVDVE